MPRVAAFRLLPYRIWCINVIFRFVGSDYFLGFRGTAQRRFSEVGTTAFGNSSIRLARWANLAFA
jgi:hypothetical protein